MNEDDLDVRLQLTGCKFGSMVNDYVNKLKWGSNCTFKDRVNLFLIANYLKIAGNYEIGNENNCFTEDELKAVFEQVIAITGLCFQPYGYTYAHKCVAPTAICRDPFTAIIIAQPTTLLALDVDGGSVDSGANQNPGIASYQISWDGITYSNTLDYDCTDIGANIPIFLKVTNNCGLSSICETTVNISDAGFPCP